MANTGCVGDHPKHLFGDGVARNHSLSPEEESCRRGELRNPLVLFVVNLYACFKTFAQYLISLSSVFGILLSVLSTLYVYETKKEEYEDGTFSGASMDWFLLAHSSWSWNDKNGKSVRECNKDFDWLDHADDVLRNLLTCADELFHFLTLPTMSRARHRVTNMGQEEAKRIVVTSYGLYDSMYTRKFVSISRSTEILKNRGLPGNEASRIRQWERAVGESIEQLRMLKMYRTPQALRSFARMFSLFLPPFYAPAFAQLAHESNSIGLGISFAIIISLALSAIFNSILILEDPFVGFITLDGIDVREELVVQYWHQLLETRRNIFPEAPEFLYDHINSCHLSPNVRTTSYVSITDAVNSPSIGRSNVAENILRCEE